MFGTSTIPYSAIKEVAVLGFGDFSVVVVIVCSLLLAVMIINHIVHTAGGEHSEFGIDEDDAPDI